MYGNWDNDNFGINRGLDAFKSVSWADTVAGSLVEIKGYGRHTYHGQDWDKFEEPYRGLCPIQKDMSPLRLSKFSRPAAAIEELEQGDSYEER